MAESGASEAKEEGSESRRLMYTYMRRNASFHSRDEDRQCNLRSAFRHPRMSFNGSPNEPFSSSRARFDACDVKETAERDYRIGIIGCEEV